MKRKGVLLLALLLAACLWVPVSATEPLTFSLSDLSASPGDDVTLSICVENNTGNMAGCRLELMCNTSVLVPATTEGDEPDLAVEKGAAFSLGSVEGHLTPWHMRLAWWAFGSPMAWNGEMMKVTLHIAEGAPEGKYDIILTCDMGDVSDKDGNTIISQCVSGSVTVHHKACDVNSDGSVDVADMACLFAYISQGRNIGHMQRMEDLQAVADINGDSAVDILDYQALYKKIQ